jgi:hypothetical protein
VLHRSVLVGSEIGEELLSSFRVNLFVACSVFYLRHHHILRDTFKEVAAFAPTDEQAECAHLVVERCVGKLLLIAPVHLEVRDEPAPNTRIVELGENAITLQAEFWIDDPMNQDILTARSDFRRTVKRRFDEEEITLAPPSAQSLSGEVTVTGERTDPSGNGS